MGQRWTIEGHPEWEIELITLDGNPVFRVQRRRYLVGYCRTVPELDRLLAQHDLSSADLIELDQDP